MGFGLVFDMDGVLFDSHPVHRKVWRELLAALGRPVSGAELDFVMDGARGEEILRHFLGPLSPGQIALYTKQKDALFRNEEENVRTIEGVEAFLDLVEAAAVPKAIVTSASRARTKRLLDLHELTSRFAVIVTGDDVANGKSHPAIYLRSAEELRVAPCDVLVLEDAIPATRTAKGIGMKCVGIATGARRRQLLEAGADFVVPNFTQLRLSDVSGLFAYPTSSHRA
jgi:HAD superfamily hydrolase (TIGR01509 family)